MNTNKPIPAKIILSLSNPTDTGEYFLGLSNTLYCENLIYSNPRELRRKGQSLELFVTFRDVESFGNWQSNEKIKEYWSDKFITKLQSKPLAEAETNMIIEVDNVGNCNCISSEFYILQGRSFLFLDELSCNSCLKQIPYSRIPLDIKIEDLQKYHQRFYLNWLDSGLFEKDALEELTNYTNGKLNQEFRKIREQLSRHFGIPVYINYFVEEPDSNDFCVICKDVGIDSKLKQPSRICLNCNTIF